MALIHILLFLYKLALVASFKIKYHLAIVLFRAR